MSDYERVQVETADDHSFIPSNDGSMLDGGDGMAGAPIIGHANNAQSALWGMVEGDVGVVGGTAQIMAAVADVANFAHSWGDDPIKAFAGALVDILVPLIEPLERLIHQVSGDPGAMRDAADAWQGIAEADTKLSEAVAETLTPLADWVGSDGDAARARIDDMAAALFGLAKQCTEAQQVLACAQVLAEAIKEAIKWLLSKLVEWLIKCVMPQLTLAPLTGGATAATAVATASVEAASTTTKAVGFTQRIISAMTQLGELLLEFMRSDPGGIIVASLQYTPGTLGNAIGAGPDGSAATAGSGSGVTADPAVLDNVSPTFDMIAEDASGVADTASSTAQDDLAWGMCGAFGMVEKYTEMVNELDSLHRDAADSLGQLATNISDSAADWRTADADSSALFTNVDTELQDT